MSNTPETDAELDGINAVCKEDRKLDAMTSHARKLERERDEWKNKAYSHATDYTLMEAKCFRLEQQLKEYDKLKS